MTEPKTVKLGDVADVFDCEHKTAPTQSNGYPLIRTPNIGRGRFILSDVKKVSQEVYEQWTRRSIPSKGDLIFAREAPVGNVAVIKDNEKYCLGQRTVLIKPNQQKVDSEYLCYLILAPEIQSHFSSRTNGATVGHFNLADLRNLNLDVLPPLPIQKKIAKVLGDLDDKIELNRRMNETLEEMAMAVYRHYFVNFGLPPGAKEEATECPFGKLIEHPEMGMIPEGWSVGKISDFAKSMQYGYTQSSTLEPIGPKFLRITDIQGGIVHWDNVPYCKINTNDYEKYKIIKGDIFIARTGASTGENTYIISEVDAVFASYLIRLQFDDLKLARYIGQYLRTQDYFSYISGIIGGSAQPNASAPILAGALVLKPSDKVLNQFYSKMNKYDELKESNSQEIQSLTETRDYLLPRLLSGDVRVG